MAEPKTEEKEEPRPASGGRYKITESGELEVVEPPTAPEPPPEPPAPEAARPEPVEGEKETEDAK
jgi:hypothetical protein